MVRDLARKIGKEIDFTISGGETELDRSVIEVIGDPLMHLIRNCVDHGIEPPETREAAGKARTGTIALRARHEENHILIEIDDDGKGIDPQAIREKAIEAGLISQPEAVRLTDKEAVDLIFLPGFTTVEVVSDISGRGVGMDVVRNNIHRFGAVVQVDSQVGRGTKFTIRLPLTLAIIRALLVDVCDEVYCLPLSAVQEAMETAGTRIHRINSREVALLRGEPLPLIRLGDIFGAKLKVVDISPLQGPRINTEHIVVVGSGTDRIGIVVDSLVGEQEIVIKALSNQVGETRGLSGATILGDGRIALIIDLNGLLSIATERKVEAYAA
jgi:two-component system chemotaxis sensor kinase CheA